jgi:hypothetical protein
VRWFSDEMRWLLAHASYNKCGLPAHAGNNQGAGSKYTLNLFTKKKHMIKHLIKNT